MATTGVVDGSILRITNSGSVIAYATSCTFSRTRNTTDRIHKDLTSGQVEKNLQEATTTISVEGFFNFDGTANTPDDLNTAFENKTLLTMELTTSETGDVEYQFSAYCTALEFSAEAQQDATFSATFDVDGAVTSATIT